MVAGALTANAHVLARFKASLYGPAQHELNRLVAFVEIGCQQFHDRIAVQTQGKLSHVARNDGEAGDILMEMIGKNGIGLHFANTQTAQDVQLVRAKEKGRVEQEVKSKEE